MSLIDSQSAELLANWAVLTVQESHAAPSGRGETTIVHRARESPILSSPHYLFSSCDKHPSVKEYHHRLLVERRRPTEGLEKKSLLSSLRFDV